MVFSYMCECSYYFQQNYTHAQLSVTDRSVQTNAVIESLEDNMELLCTTGVEDKLQVSLCMCSVLFLYHIHL